MPLKVLPFQSALSLMTMCFNSKTRPLAVISFGGLMVEERASQVLRGDHSAVPGLYAVGEWPAPPEPPRIHSCHFVLS
jgi:hypothetical protein